MRNGKRQTMRSRLNPHNNNLAYIEIGRSRAHILISSYTFQFVRSFVCVFACAMYIYITSILMNGRERASARSIAKARVNDRIFGLRTLG